MPGAPHPTLKTYEQFLEGMAKEDESVKRYFYSQIAWADKERARLAAKSKRQRAAAAEKRKATAHVRPASTVPATPA
jgi:hypothetical protein